VAVVNRQPYEDQQYEKRLDHLLPVPVCRTQKLNKLLGSNSPNKPNSPGRLRKLLFA
jgi:hypothetical protein